MVWVDIEHRALLGAASMPCPLERSPWNPFGISSHSCAVGPLQPWAPRDCGPGLAPTADGIRVSGLSPSLLEICFESLAVARPRSLEDWLEPMGLLTAHREPYLRPYPGQGHHSLPCLCHLHYGRGEGKQAGSGGFRGALDAAQAEEGGGTSRLSQWSCLYAHAICM